MLRPHFVGEERASEAVERCQAPSEMHRCVVGGLQDVRGRRGGPASWMLMECLHDGPVRP